MKDNKFEDDNPYSTPVEIHNYVPSPSPHGATGAYINQVKPLCICMIIQGVLEILMGGIYTAMIFVMPAIMNQQGAAGGPQIPGQQQQTVQLIVGLVYGIGGGIALIAGLLRIVSGIRGLSYRGYSMGVASHFFGMLNIITCYCVPTSLGLCIWGCIVYFNPEVKYAFKMGAEGQDAAKITAEMTGRQHY